MAQDKSFVVGGVPAGALCRAISEPGTSTETFRHTGGTRVVTSATHAVDVALRIKRNP
ncbi:MAG: hypothetical protein M1541_18860 [Acidobacteria bacterium]|nr:hypothetical protein [Acidobacteriota bacterium]